jgi:hypothetical protein
MIRTLSVLKVCIFQTLIIQDSNAKRANRSRTIATGVSARPTVNRQRAVDENVHPRRSDVSKIESAEENNLNSIDVLAVNYPGFKCEAGKAFMDGCNSCFCAADGKSAACSRKACPPKQKRGF